MTLPSSPAAKENQCEQSEAENLPDHDSRRVWFFLSCPVEGPFAAACASFIPDSRLLFVQWRGKVWLVTKKGVTQSFPKVLRNTRCILRECVKEKGMGGVTHETTVSDERGVYAAQMEETPARTEPSSGGNFH